MLRIRPSFGAEDLPWQTVLPGSVATGLHEDTDYLLDVGPQATDVFIDDVALVREHSSAFRWRPAFYAGRVSAEAIHDSTVIARYLLDVSPSYSKSGQDEFDAMVAEIREFDQSLLSGLSSATMAFGREGRRGRYELDVQLSRLREYGPAFLNAIEIITQKPHRFLTANTQVLPLSRVRRLHHSALRDRRLVAIVSGQGVSAESMDAFQVNGLTSTPSFDTPANRSLRALLLRFRAAVVALEGAVERLELGSPREEQLARADRRLRDLASLAMRTNRSLFGQLFREVSKAETSAAGLTQISAQPNYSKAYRLGSRALVTQVDGSDLGDQLHVPPSWGIYENWCFLCVMRCVAQITGQKPVERPSMAASSERSVRFDLSSGHWLEVLFQAKFPSLKVASNRLAWSISGERRPDLVLVHHRPEGAAAMILDAKWRSGRDNVLDAMESAHIYHDALRLGSAQPSPCVLLLPGTACVAELEQQTFVKAHSVGAISSVRIAAPGLPRVQEVIADWLRACELGSDEHPQNPRKDL